MTIDEFNKQINEYNEQINVLRYKKIDLQKEFTNEMIAKYSNFVGKKVKITFNSAFAYRELSVIGYFNGFSNGTYCPIMQVFKVKKDGTKSKQFFAPFDLPHYDDEFKIEIV